MLLSELDEWMDGWWEGFEVGKKVERSRVVRKMLDELVLGVGVGERVWNMPPNKCIHDYSIVSQQRNVPQGSRGAIFRWGWVGQIPKIRHTIKYGKILNNAITKFVKMLKNMPLRLREGGAWIKKFVEVLAVLESEPCDRRAVGGVGEGQDDG